MKKVSSDLQFAIVKDYLGRVKYKDIMKRYGVNRWNIQDALSKFGVKTDRIKSPPRLPSNIGKPGKTIEPYHGVDYLPPMKPNKNNPVLEGDLDIMERLDNCDDTDYDGNVPVGSYEMVIDNEGEVRYEECT